MITELDPKTALVLIDMQKGIVGLPLAHPAGSIIEKSAKLVAAFHAKKQPVFILNVNPLGANWTLARVDQPSGPKDWQAITKAKAEMEKNGFFEIIPEIASMEGDTFITKNTWSAFHNTPLNKNLQSADITGIVLAGIATSIGIEGTARDASQLGYNITFAEDAMTDMHLPAHENSLKYIFPRIGEIGDTDTIIEKLPVLQTQE